MDLTEAPIPFGTFGKSMETDATRLEDAAGKEQSSNEAHAIALESKGKGKGKDAGSHY
jgi:hypothetical protein